MLTLDLLDKYRTEYFIETGTHSGRAVEMALELGIPHIHSVEVWEHMYRQFVQQLGESPTVRLYLGQSPDMLPQMMSNVNDQATIFLDAHAATETDDREKYGKSPVLFEIEVIAKHPVKNHIIMVDDIDDFDLGQYDDIYGKVDVDMIKREITKIDKKYKFEIYHKEGGSILVSHL